jgi:NAD(P)H-hydrate epimerase
LSQAAATLTLALPKAGLLTPAAAPYVGELYLADIGVPPQLYAGLGLEVGPLLAQDEIL